MANINEQQREDLGTAFNLTIKALRLYIVDKMHKLFGENWPDKFRDALTYKQKENWDFGEQNKVEPVDRIDFHYLKRFILKYKDILYDDFERDTNKLPTWSEEIAEVRHQWAHQVEIEKDDFYRVFDNMIKIAGILEMQELVDELKNLKAGKKKKEVSKKNTGSIPPWFQVVTPHSDIRQGILDESVFAANLAQVALNTARPVYQDPNMFLSKTFFTAGLKNIARRVVRGLNGQEDADNRVISLQTGFGGGKTHTLITLYHLALAGKKIKEDHHLSEVISYIGNPEYDKARVAVFTNATNDPVQGREVEGHRINTLWGELAWQLGGKEGYGMVRANDENRTAPKGIFSELLNKVQPALILIDELADYCVSASAVKVGASNLADQTISFIQELSEAVAGAKNCMLVATLPASESEVATSEEGARILHSLSQRIARVGADTNPVEEEEIYELVKRRLFEDIGEKSQIDHVISKYTEYYNSLVISNEIPTEVSQMTYIRKMKKAYPFHPELIEMFRSRWASHHDFQRTRGVLRLLASIVSDLWKRRHNLSGSQGLIHTSHVDFGKLDALSAQLKKLEGNGYEAVISADVSGDTSNAYKADEKKKEYGQYDISKGVANTILLSSCGTTANKGITLEYIKLCVIRPETFNHNAVNGVMDILEERAFYLHYTTIGREKKYWFHTKANINILINQAKEDISQNDAIISSEIKDRLNSEAKKIDFFKTLVSPSEDIPEQKRPTLIVLDPEYRSNPETINSNTIPVIEKKATKKGTQERIYRNTMIFLICNEQGYGKLYTKTKEFLACKKVEEEMGNQLEKDQLDDLKNKIRQLNKDTDQVIADAWSILIKYRSRQGPEKFIMTQFSDTFHEQVNHNVKQRLKDEEWLIESVGLNLLRKNNLLPEPGKPVRVKDIYEAFIRYDDKPIISGPKAIQDSLIKYCLNGVLAIGSSEDGVTFSKMYYKESVLYFEVEEETYWILDKSDYKPDESEDIPGVYPAGPALGGVEEPEAETVSSAEDEKNINTLTISGKVPIENWSYIFTSFINPLKNFRLNIEIKISAKSTESNPIKENSSEVKIAKESARQLGLDFEEE
jgi:hypothetical protein